MRPEKPTDSAEEAKIYGQDTAADEKISEETGLYELYMNVVKRFNDKMIEEAERYAGTSHPGVNGEVLPKEEWIARDGTTGHGPGMSYSFGGKQSIGQFNKDPGGGFVRGCTASKSVMEPKLVISTNGVSQSQCNSCHYSSSTDKKFRMMNVVKTSPVDGNYQGNVKSNSCGLDGSQKYPGLTKDEYYSKDGYPTYDINSQTVNGLTTAFPQLNAIYWSGTDCSNLVQRSIIAAKNLNITGVVVNMGVSLNDNLSTEIDSGSFCKIPQEGQTIMPTDHAYGVPLDSENKTNAKKLRRGDVVTYDGHVSIVHSKNPSCKDTKKGSTCSYEIIHAYGGDTYFDRSIGRSVFSRKVIRTLNDLPSRGGGILQPTGFGRIKLWD